MKEFFSDPWPFLWMVVAMCITVLIAMAIVTEKEVDPDMQACIEAGGSYLDLSHNDLCLMGTVVAE